MKRRDFLRNTIIGGAALSLGLSGDKSRHAVKPALESAPENGDHDGEAAAHTIESPEEAAARERSRREHELQWPVLKKRLADYVVAHSMPALDHGGDRGRDLVSMILADRDPISHRNLMARMMLSEESQHDLVACLIGYVAANRYALARDDGYSFSDVIFGYGNEPSFAPQMEKGRPFASHVDPLGDDETLKKAFQGGLLHTLLEREDYSELLHLVFSHRRLRYRILADMILSPSQPLKDYNFGQTLFMNPFAQTALNEKYPHFVRPPEEREALFIKNFGAVPLDIPLGNVLGEAYQDYIAFYVITDPRDPFAINKALLADNPFVRSDIRVGESG